MPVERRGQAIVCEIGSTGDGRNPIINGRRQPSRGGTSRMNREVQVRICERLGVKFPGPTRPKCGYQHVRYSAALGAGAEAGTARVIVAIDRCGRRASVLGGPVLRF